MNTHLLHVRGTYDEAAPVLADWIGRDLEPEELAITPEDNGWTTLSMDIDYQDTEEWERLAQSIDLFYESFSPASEVGEVVSFRDRQIVRHLHLDHEMPEENINLGTLASEAAAPLKTWRAIQDYIAAATWKQDL